MNTSPPTPDSSALEGEEVYRNVSIFASEVVRSFADGGEIAVAGALTKCRGSAMENCIGQASPGLSVRGRHSQPRARASSGSARRDVEQSAAARFVDGIDRRNPSLRRCGQLSATKRTARPACTPAVAAPANRQVVEDQVQISGAKWICMMSLPGRIKIAHPRSSWRPRNARYVDHESARRRDVAKRIHDEPRFLPDQAVDPGHVEGRAPWSRCT